MIRPVLSVDVLEDRTTPVAGSLNPKVVAAAVSIPPQDPMDNPPPTQPGTGGTTTPVPQPTPTPTPTPPAPRAFTLFMKS
jgi:hypothetical protein